MSPENHTKRAFPLDQFIWYEDFLGYGENTARKYDCNYEITSLCNSSAEGSKIQQSHVHALVTAKMGKWQQTETLRLEVLSGCQKLLGETHPSTLLSLVYLADVYMKQSEYVKAEQVQRQVSEGFEKALGSGHPYTLGSVNELASTLMMQQRWKEAEVLLDALAETINTAVGEGHPVRLSILQNLARVYKAQGRFNDAEEIMENVIGISREILGPEDSDTLQGMNTLINMCMFNYEWEEAEALQIHVLEVQKKTLGVDHMTTLASMENLAFLCKKQDQMAQAQAVQEMAVNGFKRRLGVGHLLTQNAIQELTSLEQASAAELKRNKERKEKEERAGNGLTRVKSSEELLDDRILALKQSERIRMNLENTQCREAIQMKYRTFRPSNGRELFDVYSALRGCFHGKLPRCFILQIMDDAKYWIRNRMSRADSLIVSMKSCEDRIPYLISAPIEQQVKQIRIGVWSHGKPHFLEDSRNGSESFTGFKIGIERPSAPEESGFYTLFANPPTGKVHCHTKIYEFCEPSNTEIPMPKPGDMVSIIPIVYSSGWENFVQKAFIEISTSCLVSH